MKSVEQFLVGLFSAAGISLLILSAFTLALLEGGISTAALPPTPEVSPTAPPATPVMQNSTPQQTEALQPTNTATVTATLASSCAPPPADWVVYIVKPGETLEMIASRAGTTADQVSFINCLPPGFRVVADMQIRLPFVAPTNTIPAPLPTAPPTATATTCAPPAYWVPYIVRRGDTLSSIGRAFGVSAFQLQVGNCLPSDRIDAGQQLMVPNVPTRTPTSTPTPTQTILPTDTNTPEVVPTEPEFTATPTSTDTPETVEPTATDTDMPTPTPTVTSTDTATPTSTPTEGAGTGSSDSTEVVPPPGS